MAAADAHPPLPVRPSRRNTFRRGAAAVEFGLLLPLLMLILLGAIDFGRFAHAHIGVTNAARAGAGFAAMNPFSVTTKTAWETQIRRAALDELRSIIDSDPRLTNNNVTVTSVRTFDDPQATSLWYADVTVSMPFRTLVTWPGIPRPLVLTHTVRFRGIR
jgi:Flp pilus assembly protein TadG